MSGYFNRKQLDFIRDIILKESALATDRKQPRARRAITHYGQSSTRRVHCPFVFASSARPPFPGKRLPALALAGVRHPARAAHLAGDVVPLGVSEAQDAPEHFLVMDEQAGRVRGVGYEELCLALERRLLRGGKLVQCRFPCLLFLPTVKPTGLASRGKFSSSFLSFCQSSKEGQKGPNKHGVIDNLGHRF